MRNSLLLLAMFGTSCWAQPILSARDYSERCVAYYARQYDVDPALVRAVIEVESAWNPGAVSSTGAMGLMQLMPTTARRYGATHPFWIDENVRAGVAYLADLLQFFHGDLRLVMAAYNAGENRIAPQLLSYSNRNVYIYVSRVAHVYRAELRRGGKP
jgi:soluble lytic murein transglycosylase-like protein